MENKEKTNLINVLNWYVEKYGTPEKKDIDVYNKVKRMYAIQDFVYDALDKIDRGEQVVSNKSKEAHFVSDPVDYIENKLKEEGY